jgi:hypothetical protein
MHNAGVNFRELWLDELRSTLLPRTGVNKGEKKPGAPKTAKAKGNGFRSGTHETFCSLLANPRDDNEVITLTHPLHSPREFPFDVSGDLFPPQPVFEDDGGYGRA